MGAWSVSLRPARMVRAMGWLPLTTLVLSVLGLVDSSYQCYADLTGTGLAGCSPCSASSSTSSWLRSEICPYCTSVHGITFLLFSLIVFQATAPSAQDQRV
jgi:uncharacterized membrane protein